MEAQCNSTTTSEKKLAFQVHTFYLSAETFTNKRNNKNSLATEKSVCAHPHLPTNVWNWYECSTKLQIANVSSLSLSMLTNRQYQKGNNNIAKRCYKSCINKIEK